MCNAQKCLVSWPLNVAKWPLILIFVHAAAWSLIVQASSYLICLSTRPTIHTKHCKISSAWYSGSIWYAVQMMGDFGSPLGHSFPIPHLSILGNLQAYSLIGISIFWHKPYVECTTNANIGPTSFILAQQLDIKPMLCHHLTKLQATRAGSIGLMVNQHILCCQGKKQV